MTSRDFVYWLQGVFELADPKTLNEKQTDLIRRHLNLVFYHEIDPSMGDKEHQGKLNSIHNGVNSSINTSTGEVESSILNLLHTQPIMTEGFNPQRPSSTANNINGQPTYRC